MTRESLSWIGGALLVVVGVLTWLWMTRPTDNPLFGIYGIM
ncbi:MAG: hypothetical protein QGG40_08005 [Myxococcota bacterium]|jgi:hypothetical protein|nr:hypothetical protein [Myxococcota bacterium]